MVWGPWGMREPWGGAPGVCESPHSAGACPSLAQQGLKKQVLSSLAVYLALKKTEIRHVELLCRAYTLALAWRGVGGQSGVQGAQPRGPLPRRSGRQGRPHAHPCPSPLSFRFWGAPCVLGTSPGCAPLTGCRALPLSQGAGDWLLPASPGPLPSFSSWLCGSRAPKKSGQGDFYYCQRKQTSHLHRRGEEAVKG